MTLLEPRPLVEPEWFVSDVPKVAPPTPPVVERRFRPDIQGLRAVAVLIVALYHAKLPGLGGGYVGVDVFFVISGFLITRHLVDETVRHGRPSLLSFYVRRIRRLLPAAALVAISTLVAARIWLPALQVKDLGADALFTAAYGMNFHLAAQGVDYQEIAGAASPFQHFWSLAVEEQFYVFWPLLVILCAFAGARYRRAALFAVLVVTVAVSLYFSITVTQTSAPWAYFSIHTRAWELGLGGLLAIVAPHLIRQRHHLAAAVSWVGLAMIVGAAFIYTDATPYPGSAALLPVLGTVLVIAAGCSAPRAGAERLLGRRPMQGLGKVSYSWYLWHWPMLIIVPAIAGYEFGWIRNLEVLVLSLWVATLAYFLVETPALRSRMRRPAWLTTGVALSAATAMAGLLVVASLPALVGKGEARSLARSSTAADGTYLKQVSAAISTGVTSDAAPRNLRPVLTDAATDVPSDKGQDCLEGFAAKHQGPCVFGDPHGAKTMVLVGDSHANQWLPGFSEAGRREGWKVVSWTKSACPFAQVSIRNPQLGRAYTECDQWRAGVLRRIVRMKPDRVFVGQSDSVVGKAFTNEVWADKTVQTLDVLKRHGIPSTYMLDIPYPATDVPRCVSKHLASVTSCNRDLSTLSWVAERHAVVQTRIRAAGYRTVEPRAWLCTSTKCPVIVGNLLVYRDASHLTATYSAWLAPMMQSLLPGHTRHVGSAAATPASTRVKKHLG